MRRSICCLFTCFYCFLCVKGQNQDCAVGTANAVLHANNVRTYISNAGTLFLSEDTQSAYQVPYTGSGTPTTIYAHGPWLSGRSSTGALLLSAQDYAIASGESDYLPGPLDLSGELLPNCNDWNKTWSVYRHEVDQHLVDFEDNNNIDTPINSIFSWPGKGNPHFEWYNGFPLPAMGTSYAPFFDANEDGIYNPTDGDYPMISQSIIYPAQIVWTVFNDLGDQYSGGTPLGVEIQLTAWAMRCEGNRLLNNGLFSSFKLINRTSTPIDSVHFGLFTDFSIGCFLDDYIGCAPALNTTFAYNNSNVEPLNCSFTDFPGHGSNPPVQALTILNKELTYHTYYRPYPGWVVPFPGFVEPFAPIEYHYYLTGRWRDGSTLQFGELGYDTESTAMPVSFAFPDNPNDTTGWSMSAVEAMEQDYLSVSSMYLGALAAGESETIDVGYTYYREPSGEVSNNIEAMYNGIEQLQMSYDIKFANSCFLPDYCETDCLYVGDTNADGIANHCDLLPIALALGQSGPSRADPYFWSPITATDWPQQQYDGTNFKHIDANGNGEIEIADIEVVLDHYNYTIPGYTPIDNYNEGDDLYLELLNGDFEDILAGGGIWQIYLNEIPDLYGLAFSLEYDSRYFEEILPLSNGFFPDTALLEFTRSLPERSTTDFAYVFFDQEIPIFPYVIEAGFLRRRDPLPELPPLDTTFIRFKNVKGFLEDGTSVELEGRTTRVIFRDSLVQTSAPTEPTQATVHAYPNPTHKRLTIASQRGLITAVQLYTLSGKEVWQEHTITAPQYEFSVAH
ncbi:MAG: hypothetical protein AAF798_06040, partial [Bacteroidota bacterium]